MDERDRVRIEHLRDVLSNSAWVDDENAVEVFRNVGLVFDLSPNGRRLEAFLRENASLKAVAQFSEGYTRIPGDYRFIGGIVPERLVYFGHKKPGASC